MVAYMGCDYFFFLNFRIHEQVGSLHKDSTPCMASANNQQLNRKCYVNLIHEQMTHYGMEHLNMHFQLINKFKLDPS
jgi:hypothetical protein